jgi:hypothetical protein
MALQSIDLATSYTVESLVAEQMQSLCPDVPATEALATKYGIELPAEQRLLLVGDGESPNALHTPEAKQDPNMPTVGSAGDIVVWLDLEDGRVDEYILANGVAQAFNQLRRHNRRNLAMRYAGGLTIITGMTSATMLDGHGNLNFISASLVMLGIGVSAWPRQPAQDRQPDVTTTRQPGATRTEPPIKMLPLRR